VKNSELSFRHPHVPDPGLPAIMVGADGGGLERTQKRTLPESVVASKWRDEVFEPTVAAVPDELWGRLPAAEIFHQVLEHRWFLSEKAKKDIGIEKAVRSYVMSELPTRPPERIVLPAPPQPEPEG